MTSKGTKLSATVVSGHTFTVDTRYELKDSKILGRGSYGVVTTAIDKLQHGKIAIKRIRPFANDEWDARHTLREIRLLKLLGPHPNIITLFDLSLFEDKTELYMMMELMDCDLHQIIQSKQSLSDMHHKCFAKQMLEGIKAMHDIGVFHRDLKPGNILVSKDCKLRITDFGLARFVDEATAIGENSLNPLTEYVVTRWYRCPELLLAPNRPYNDAIDMWAVGCILAELLRRKPLFPGKSHANQVQLIFEVIGYSTVASLGFEVSAEASSFLEKRCRSRGQSLSTVIPQASAHALQLISRLLAVDPTVRPTASQALAFDYLKDAEILCDYDKQYLSRPPSTLFDFESEKYSLEQLKELIVGEVRLSAAQNQELRAKLGMVDSDDASDSVRRREEPATPTPETPPVGRGTTSFSSATSSTPHSQAAATAALAAASTHRRATAETRVKYDFHNGPRDSEGRSLRRSTGDTHGASTTITAQELTAQEQQLAREQQMDTNITNRQSLSRQMSSASNVAAIAREVDAVKIAKTSSSSNSNNNNNNGTRHSEGGMNQNRDRPIDRSTDRTDRSTDRTNDRSDRDRNTDQIVDGTADRNGDRNIGNGDRNGERNVDRNSSGRSSNSDMQQSAPYGHVLSTISRGPKTPSPKKMDIIMAKGMKAKKQSLEGGVGTDEDRKADREEKVSSDSQPPVPDTTPPSNSSSFLKNRHFGFMRSSTTTANPTRPISATEVNNNNRSDAQAAGLSSLLSQFSGRYQSLSSRAKSAANGPPNPAANGSERTVLSSDVMSKPVALKPVRASSAPTQHSALR